MKYIDLSHEFTGTMPTYPGDPEVELKQIATFDEDAYNDHQLSTPLHVGTHMDAPLHMIKDGAYMSDIPLEKFFGRGVLLDARGKDKIDAELFENVELKEGDVVFVTTGFSDKYRDPSYFTGRPAFTEAFAERLIEAKIKMVGMDMPSPDYEPFPVHRMLLGKGILILENLTNLKELVDVKNFEVIALPIKLRADSAFARVVARIQ